MDPRDLAAGVGGVLGMEFGPTGVAISHPLHLAVVTFIAAPVGPGNDYLYSASPAPGESGILATFTAIGACWAPYYPPSWSLRLSSLWQNVNGFATPLAVVPAAAAISGTAAERLPGTPLVKRILTLFSGLSARWHIYLRRVAPTSVGPRLQVSSSSGGVDAKDQAWLRYLSGSATAVCARDGTRFQNGGRVRVWWDTPLPPAATPAGGYVVSG
jgi:hypothetical protein